jgi:hypothetical protein
MEKDGDVRSERRITKSERGETYFTKNKNKEV